MRFALGLAVAAIVAIGCSPSGGDRPDAGGEASGCTTGFVGDPNADIALDVTATDESAENVLREGDPLPLVFPPQGGRVAFVGVRAKNIDPCNVQLSGALRDESTMQVRLDARTVNLAPQSDGTAGTGPPSQISTYSNIPACPNQWASKDLFGQAFALEVSVTDRRGRKATKTLHVVPTCNGDAECLCICRHGYKLGDSCAIDAGADAADAGAD